MKTSNSPGAGFSFGDTLIATRGTVSLSLTDQLRIGLALFVIAPIASPEIAKSQHNSEGPGMQHAQIVFVCEHGAALSVVSAAYFNKLAQEQHLNLHAVARGRRHRRILP